MPHEYEYEEVSGYPPGYPGGGEVIDGSSGSSGSSGSKSPILFRDPFTRVDPDLIISKTKESLGDPTLDRIRRITFLSLNKDTEPDLDKGILRGIKLLYSLGLGFFLTHAFSFSDDVLKNISIDDSSINGKSLYEICEGESAYRLMYKEYMRIYSKKSFYREELAKLSNIESVSPTKAKPLAKLLILLFVSSKFED